MVGEPFPVQGLCAEVVMKHFVIDDILHDVERDPIVVQDSVDPNDAGPGGIAAEPDAFLSAARSAAAPANGAIHLAVKIRVIDFLVALFKMKRWLLRGTSLPRSRRVALDFSPVLSKEDPQAFARRSAVPRQIPRKRCHYLFIRIKKHVVHPEVIGAVPPGSGNHGSPVVRHSQADGSFQKRLQRLLEKLLPVGFSVGRWACRVH